MHGFKDVLIDRLRGLKPSSIIEWGPGFSTELILRECPQARLVTIEHNPIWHSRAVCRFGTRARVLLKDCICRNSSYATCAFQYGPFDLAFVDGRRRVECIMVALQLLNPDGVIILHDCCRENYMRVVDPFVEILEIRSDTAVMRPKFSLAGRGQGTSALFAAAGSHAPAGT